MAPGFCYDNTTAVTDVQWFSPTGTTTQSTNSWYDYHTSNWESYPPKKEETVKEILIRQRAAFKMFYSIPQFSVRKSKKDYAAQYKEVKQRVDKFKGLNRNLML